MTSAISHRRLSECSLEDAAEGFTAGFSGYVVPMNVTVPSLQLRIERDHVDPDESLVYFDGEKPAGILLIGRRGDRSRVGAIGMGPMIRGRGFGRRVMLDAIEVAKARGDRKLILEVINTNERARDLYLSLGFVITRKLVGFGRSRKLAVPDVVPAEECEARDGCRDARTVRRCRSHLADGSSQFPEGRTTTERVRARRQSCRASGRYGQACPALRPRRRSRPSPERTGPGPDRCACRSLSGPQAFSSSRMCRMA
ncbi:GNAT family N-acetyltransferase [Neorhizobium galegae]|nr:GNAT family N-acetyltransferase [Neorhizobium galegae]